MKQLAIRLFAPGVSLLVVGLAAGIYLAAPAVFEDAWMKEARAVHAEWVATGRIAGARRIGGATYLTDIRALGAVPHIPDLADGFLRLERVVHIPPGAGRTEALHAGYIERHGCRLSLWMSRATAGDEPQNRDGAYGWVAGGLRYVLVGGDFADDRLHVTAVISREITRAGSGPGPGARRTLAFNAVLSPRCDP